jgi:type IV pilus assembly protein PilQ
MNEQPTPAILPERLISVPIVPVTPSAVPQAAPREPTPVKLAVPQAVQTEPKNPERPAPALTKRRTGVARQRPAPPAPPSVTAQPSAETAARNALAQTPRNEPTDPVLAALRTELNTPSRMARPAAAPTAQPAKLHPPVAEQVASPLAKDVAESLEKIQQALTLPLMNASGAAAPERVHTPVARPLSSTTAVPAPRKTDQAAKPQASNRMEPAEGDGRLRIQFAETDVRDVLDSLAEYGGLNILAGRTVQGKVSVRLRNVDIDEALAAVVRQAGFVSRREGNFIYVGSPDEVDTMQQTYGKITTRVYRPNYVSSAELEKLIKPLLSEKIGKITKFEPTTNQAGTGSSNGGGSSGSGSGAGSGSNSSNFEGADGYAGTEVVVVRDYEAVLGQVDELVAEVDVRPMQVGIEAMILSVKLNDTDKLGINFELLKQRNPNLTLNIGQAAEFQGTGALSIAFTDSNLHAFLDALEETNDTNVIATPRLMVLNKQRAEIHIGREQGYISSTTQTETATTSQMEMLQTGTLLRLRPFLSSDGLIRLDVHPELSTGEVIEKADTLVPDKQITQVTTNVMIRDGCTVIIGGLMREELTNTVNKIPLLGGLPVLGPLFRNTVETNEREEILVLLTPHIVYEPETCREGEQGACEFHRRQALVAEKTSCLGTRHLGRRYFRLAQNAWAAGDRDTALRYAELAVHFDPQNRAAIDLRTNIWQNQPYGKFTLQQPPATPGENPLDGPQIAGWLMDDLEHEPRVQPAPQHPLDPGRPGTHRDLDRGKVRP